MSISRRKRQDSDRSAESPAASERGLVRHGTKRYRHIMPATITTYHTQKDLADAIDRSEPVVSRWLARMGERVPPKVFSRPGREPDCWDDEGFRALLALWRQTHDVD